MPCPSCSGPQLVGHPAGQLALQHTLTCPLLPAEDATQHADYLRLMERPRPFDRASTSTERTLLAALGYDDVHVDELTHVEPLPGGKARRRWPRLE